MIGAKLSPKPLSAPFETHNKQRADPTKQSTFLAPSGGGREVAGRAIRRRCDAGRRMALKLNSQLGVAPESFLPSRATHRAARRFLAHVPWRRLSWVSLWQRPVIAWKR